MRRVRARAVSLFAAACLLWISGVGVISAVVAPTAAAAAASAPAGTWTPASIDRTPVGGSPQGPFTAHSQLPAGTVLGRTANSTTVRTSTGDNQTTVYPGPVNYQTSAGTYAPISDSLVAAPANSGEAYQNAANAFNVQLPSKATSGPVRFQLGSASAAFQLIGAGQGATVVAASAGTVAANADTFADVAPGVTLTYQVLNTGLKEDLILASPSAPHTFTYSLAIGPGLTPKASSTGGIDFVGSDGRVQFTMPAPFMSDGAGNLSHAVTLSLGTTAAGGYTLTLAADPTWLAATGRAYPVTIDPTITLTGANQDCFLLQNYPTSSYCGASYMNGGAGTGALRPMLQFDLASSGIPVNAQVLSAKLALYNYSNSTGTATPIELHQLTQAWTMNADWNTYDGTNSWATAGGDFASGSAYTNQSVGGSTGWDYWYPTALVQNWLDGSATNDGMILKEPSPESTVNIIHFYSSEYYNSAYWPSLTVTYQPRVGEQRYYKQQSFPLDNNLTLNVNVADGNAELHLNLNTIQGTGLNQSLAVVYNSQLHIKADLGNRWYWAGDSGLQVFSSGSVTYYDRSGYQINFTQNADGSFSAPTGIDATLVQNGDGTYTMTLLGTGEKYSFSAYGALMSEVDRNGNTISFAYNNGTYGEVTSITDTQGRITTFSYNASGFITTITDPASRTYQFGYNSYNNLTSYTDPAGNVTDFSYDSNNDLVQVTDPNGNETTLTYNSASPYAEVSSVTRVTNNSTGSGYTWDFTYNPDSSDAAGNTVVTDPNGNGTTYYYDVQGRATKVVDAKGNATSLSYTADSNVSQQTNPSNDTTSYAYDNVTGLPTGATLASATLPTGAEGTFTYGDSSFPFFPTIYTDPQGNTLDYAYDSNGNLTSVTDGLSSHNKYSFTYNSDGTLASMTDAMGNSTSYGYDTYGNLTSITPPSPLGGTSIGYDGLSRITSVTDGKSQTTDYTYNKLNEVTKISYSDGTSVSYTYDGDGNVTSMTDGTGTTDYSYDALNRLTKKTLPSSATLTYGYDGVGNLTSFADSGGSVSYGYNSVNDLTSVTDPSSNQTTYTYNAEYQPTSIAYPNGVTMTLGYNSAGQLSSIVAKNSGGTELTGYTYSYTNPSTSNATALRYSVQDAAGNTTAYRYDVLNRLTEAKTTNGGTTVSDYQYAYDGNGNRTSQTVNGTQTTYTYNAANEMTAAGSTTYTYDGNGNETGNSAGLSLSYNAANLTSSITPPSASAIAMTYTGPNQVQRVSAGSTDYQNGLLGVANETTSGSTTYYTRTPSGQLVSERTSGGVYYYLFDGLGSVVGLTDSIGNLINTYQYDPYGNVTSQSGSVSNPWQFAGTYYDGTTGLYKMGARYYDPTTARFTQEDPSAVCTAHPSVGNLYRYASDSPISFADPSGAMSLYCAASLGALVVGAAGIVYGAYSAAPTIAWYGFLVLRWGWNTSIDEC